MGEILPLRDLNRSYALWAYERLGGRKGQTAEKLGVDPKTLNNGLPVTGT